MGQVKQILLSLQNRFLDKSLSRTRVPRSTPTPLLQGRGRSIETTKICNCFT